VTFWAAGRLTQASARVYVVVAPSQKLASSVLANFKQVVKQGGDVRIHPMVARQVDPELLKKMGAAVDAPGESS
jgi:hypothetical protein